MWWWQRGCCGVCGHLVHPLAVLVLSTPLPLTHTHTRGGGHVVVVAVCVVWLPPPLCPIPTNHHHCVRCPALSAVCVCVRGGTRHSGALWWHPRWCVCVWLCVRRAHHTHHPRCPPLSPLSPRSPHPTPATRPHGTPHATHTHGVLCVPPPIHSLTHTGCLTAHTPDTHTRHWVCVRPSTCSHPPPHTHTHGTHRRGACMGGWACGHHHHAPCARHSLTHTAGLVVGAMVVRGGVGVGCVCLPRPQPPRHPSHHHHQRSCATTHTRDLVDAPLPHTHATCTTTLTNACCVVPTPCHSLTHATSHTHPQ